MNNKEKSQFSIRLKYLREEVYKENQSDFACRIGIPQPTLSTYELDKNKPPLDTLLLISKACNVSIDWLCGNDIPIHLKSLGDIYNLFFELFEINDFGYDTVIHNKVDYEDYKSKDDSKRNWVNLRIYYNEVQNNPAFHYNSTLCDAIEKAYKLSKDLRECQISQDLYEREKEYWIKANSGFGLTREDHSNLSEADEYRIKMEYRKAEFEEYEKKNKNNP